MEAHHVGDGEDRLKKRTQKQELEPQKTKRKPPHQDLDNKNILKISKKHGAEPPQGSCKLAGSCSMSMS